MNNLYLNKFYILGCSGGPDSMALFDMLLKEHINFAVAFVNYHKRDISDDEEKMVKKYAEDHNVKFYALSAKKTTSKGNFQAWARVARYEFFYELATSFAADGIIIAHQLDDLIETYLLQKKRGGIYSYYGLKDVSYYKEIPLIRPLLKYRKKDLEEYCINNNVPYSIDVSNLSDAYERNKIRHHVVEVLNNVGINEILEEITEINYKNFQENKLSENYLLNNDELMIDKFAVLSENVQKRVIYQALKDYGFIANGKEIEAIRLFILSTKSSSSVLSLANNLKIYKNYGYWEISDENPRPYIICVDRLMKVENDIFYFDLILGKDAFFIKDDSFPLYITNAPLNGTVKIGNVDKKINRFFIDEKIPMRFRNVWPCIKDKNGKIIFISRKKDIEISTDGLNKKIIFKMKSFQKNVDENSDFLDNK